MFDDAYNADRDQQLSELLNAGQLQEAMEMLESWHAQEPWNGEVLMRMAVVHWLSGEPARTLRDLDAYLQFDPENAEALSRRAQALLMLGKREDAEASLAKAEALDPDTPGVLLNRALMREAQGEYHEAITSLNAYLEKMPSDHLAIARRSHLYRQLGEFQQALIDAQACVQMHPEDPETHFAEALAWVTLEQGDEALAACDRCLQTKDGFLPALRLKIDLEADLGRLHDAERHLQELSALDADSPHTSLLQARVASERNDFSAALSWINRYLDDTPDEAHGYFRRGMIYYRMAQYDDALTDFQAFTQLLPTAVEGYEQQFMCHLEMDHVPDAVAVGQAAVQLQPQNYRLQYNLAFAQLLLGEGSNAQQGFIHALSLNHGDDELALRIYLAFVEHATLDARVDFLSAALQQVPTSTVLLKGLLAESYIEQGKIDVALQLSLEILEEEQQRAFGYLLGIKALCTLGEYAQAMQLVEAGIAALPDEGQLRIARALILRDTGQPDDALQELDAAERLQVDRDEVLRQRALVYGSIGQVETALGYLQDSLLVNAENADTYFWLGYLSIHCGRYKQALEYAQQLLLLVIDSPEGHLVRCAALRALGRHSEADEEYAWIQHIDPQLLQRIREDPVMEKLLVASTAESEGMVGRFRRTLSQRWHAIRRHG